MVRGHSSAATIGLGHGLNIYFGAIGILLGAAPAAAHASAEAGETAADGANQGRRVEHKMDQETDERSVQFACLGQVRRSRRRTGFPMSAASVPHLGEHDGDPWAD